MNPNHDVFIQGTWRAAHGLRFESSDPVRGDVLWHGNAADASDVDEACRAARSAFGDWYRSGFDERARIARRFADILEKRREDIAHSLARETGKALWDCRQELTASINKVDISIRAWNQRTGHETITDAAGTRELRHKPHGVVAVFGPFNFPLHLPNGHIIPALLAGNTVVFKPSELAPGCAMHYVDCWHEAGLAPGVLNVLNGARDTGMALLDHGAIDGVFFTGSAATGESIHRRFAGHTGKILALELGGNNPLVIADFNDAKAAILAIVQSAYVSAGQRCTCARRLLVIDSTANRELVAHLKEVIAGLVVGDPLAEPQPFIGSVISNHAADAVLAFQKRLMDSGGHALVPCRRTEPDKPYLAPGLVDVSEIANPLDEEVFGPLLQLTWVRDLDEAIARANDTRFGLSAGIVTGDDAHWERFLIESRAGVVNRNLPLTGASSAMPFGGIGASGNLRPSAFYAADYCAYPVASMSCERAFLPDKLPPGIKL
jgi:succinylglutamic semialdehyde dehydrogenase